MSKKIVYVFGAAILAACSFNTRASVLVTDTFTQPDGTNLLGTTPEVGGTVATQSGTTNPILIESGAAVVNEATGVQDDNVPFAGGVVAGTGVGNAPDLYSSFTVDIATAPTTLTSVYFAHFLSGTSDFTSRVWVTTPATAGDGYRIALSQGSIVTATGVVYSSDLAFGTTYTVATSYDYTNKNGSLWIDPADSSATPIGTTSDAGFSDPQAAYAFRQSLTAGNVIIDVDNLMVGTTFADVFPVPEPASLSLLGIGALSFMSRRRK